MLDVVAVWISLQSLFAVGLRFGVRNLVKCWMLRTSGLWRRSSTVSRLFGQAEVCRHLQQKAVSQICAHSWCSHLVSLCLSVQVEPCRIDSCMLLARITWKNAVDLAPENSAVAQILHEIAMVFLVRCDVPRSKPPSKVLSKKLP